MLLPFTVSGEMFRYTKECRTQLVRFVSTASAYLATMPIYAATLPIRQMMPRPLARQSTRLLRNIGSHAVDHNVDQSDEGFLSLARLRLARRHTPLRYRFAHAVDHNVDDSADGLRPDSHRRSGEINEASYGCSTRAVRRLVEGGDVGPKPRQTPFTLSLLESRGVVLESGGPVRPVS